MSKWMKVHKRSIKIFVRLIVGIVSVILASVWYAYNNFPVGLLFTVMSFMCLAYVVFAIVALEDDLLLSKQKIPVELKIVSKSTTKRRKR